MKKYKAREIHVFVLYILIPALRVVMRKDFVKGVETGRKFFRALYNLLTYLHLLKGFSSKVRIHINNFLMTALTAVFDNFITVAYYNFFIFSSTCSVFSLSQKGILVLQNEASKDFLHT